MSNSQRPISLAEKQVPFEGVQQRLLNYLQPILYADDLARHLPRFTGREWLKAEVEEWLTSTKRILWITGEAGVGKSAVAAWLCDKRPEIAETSARTKDGRRMQTYASLVACGRTQ